MLKKNNNWDKNKHKTVYIALTLLIFTLVASAHILVLGSKMQLSLGFITFPDSVSIFAVIMSLLMVVMGGYYLLDDE